MYSFVAFAVYTSVTQRLIDILSISHTHQRSDRASNEGWYDSLLSRRFSFLGFITSLSVPEVKKFVPSGCYEVT